MSFWGTIVLSEVAGLRRNYIKNPKSLTITSSLDSEVLKTEKNSPSSRHQNWAIYRLFLALSDAEELDRERVLGC
jgi:hypothetical protein